MTAQRQPQPLRTVPKRVGAGCYNQVRLALGRLGAPLRVPLARHRGLEMILAKDCWTCVDSLNDDLVVLQWISFDAQRSALHEPVGCQLQVYHLHAGLVMGSVLEDLEQVLARRPPPHSGRRPD